MAKDSFVIYKSFYDPIKTLSDKQLGRLFRALFDYQIEGSTKVDTDIHMAFAFFKNQMDIDESKYQKVVQRNRENGSKGGRRPKEENPKNPVGLEKPKKADNDNDNVNDNESECVAPAHARGDETDAPVSKNVLIPLSTCKDEMLKDQMWQERVCMNTHISKEQLLSLINKFIKHLENQNDTEKTIFDCYKHFGSWIARQNPSATKTAKPVVTGNFFKS